MMWAELSIRCFSTHSGLGLPVEPLVCTRSCGQSFCHSERKSCSVIVIVILCYWANGANTPNRANNDNLVGNLCYWPNWPNRANKPNNNYLNR